MRGLIQACASELNANFPYLRHPVNTVSAVARDIKRDFQIGLSWGLVDMVGLVSGSLLFALVVVPLGMVGELTRTTEKIS